MVTATIEVPQLATVQTAISKAAHDIKKVILQRIEEIKDQFPQMGLATVPDHFSSDELRGDHWVHKVADLLAIPLTSKSHHCPYMVILTLDSILKCPLVDAIRGNFCQYLPHFPKAITNDRFWTQYGEYALSLLYPRPVVLRYKNEKKDLGMAGIGEEFCRLCGKVDLAVNFRLEDRCPECRKISWLAQYGVEVD